MSAPVVFVTVLVAFASALVGAELYQTCFSPYHQYDRYEYE